MLTAMPSLKTLSVKALLPFIVGLSICSPVAAKDLACPNARASVSAPDDALAARVCAVAQRSLTQLTSCSLKQTEDVQISVVDAFDTAREGCVGLFLCHEGRVEVLQPDALEAALPNNDFKQVPMLDLFDSIVTHELTHALIYQTLEGIAGSVAQNE